MLPSTASAGGLTARDVLALHSPVPVPGLGLRAGAAAPEHHPAWTAVEMLQLLRAGHKKICFCDAFAVLRVHGSH